MQISLGGYGQFDHLGNKKCKKCAEMLAWFAKVYYLCSRKQILNA